MNAHLALAATATAALLALPGASAVISTGDQTAAFQLLLDAIAPGAADLSGLPVAYVDDTGDAWLESNGRAGLQTGATVDEQGQEWPADQFLAGMSSVVVPL